MKVCLIGAGRLATNLGKALVRGGHTITQVYSRTKESAGKLATLVGGEFVDNIGEIDNRADIYIFAIKDDALRELVPQVSRNIKEKVFCHTAGSMPLDIFQETVCHYGVFYPLQTFSKTREMDFSNIPCFLETNDQTAYSMLHALAKTVSNRIYDLSSEERKYLHLAAVFACNFVNHCYSLSGEVLAAHGLPFDVMLPLIEETARKAGEMSPLEAQTGPAVRYDENVIKAQTDLLNHEPYLQEVYRLLSSGIYQYALQHSRQ